MTPHRGPVFVDFPIDVLYGTADADLTPPAPDRRRGAGPRPGGGGRRPDPGGGPALPGGGQRRLLGRGVGIPAALRGDPAHPHVRQRLGPGLPPGRPRAGLLPHPVGAEAGRRGRRGGRSARLPAVLRPASATLGSSTWWTRPITGRRMSRCPVARPAPSPPCSTAWRPGAGRSAPTRNGSVSFGISNAPVGPKRSRSSRRRAIRSTRPGSSASCATASVLRPSSSATAGTSCPGPAG